MSRLRFILYFAFTTLCWGGSFLGIHYAIQGFSPFFAAWLRIAIGLTFLCVIWIFKGKKVNLKHKLWKSTLIFGLFNMAIPWIFLFWGEKYVAPALASILNSTVPFLIVLLAPLITPTDKFSIGKIVGLLAGFCGVAVIFYPEIQLGTGTNEFYGLISILLMALAYAIGTLGMRRLSHKMPFDVTIFYNFAGSLVLMSLVVVFMNEPIVLPEFTYKSVLAVMYLGIFSTTLAWLCFLAMIRHVGSLQATAVTYVCPLLAIMLDILILGKSLKPNQFFGAALIFTALFMINGVRIPRLGRS